MTNWPNIQEYKNLEVKFFDDSSHIQFFNAEESNNLFDSAKTRAETTIQSDIIITNSWEDLVNQRNCTSESKTVRCVIKKDFEESFKNLDRGDGVLTNNETAPPKAVVVPILDQSTYDKVRLENHLKWKKQKEEEYLRKKETEKIACQKKKEEEMRMERIKKQKEIDREQKIREWQEQKAREKEEKRREKLVMKVLEKELKQVTPKVDKERLIEEWVKLKNKQKQIEAEKRSECLKKEQESRKLRQSLAELSYRQWKERIKGRSITLPKNGYQIFGPKPVPVVKEDWNHNFTSNSPRHQPSSLRSSKSSITNCANFQPLVKEIEDLSKDIFSLNEIKNLNPNFHPLKTVKSGTDLYYRNKLYPNIKNEMPLKELQMETIDIKSYKKNLTEKKENKTLSNFNCDESSIKLKRIPFDLCEGKEMQDKYFSPDDCLSSFKYLCLEQGDQNCFNFTPQIKVQNPVEFPKVHKNKIDLFLNTSTSSPDKKSPVKKKKKNIIKCRSTTKKEDMIKDVPNVLQKISYSSKKCFHQNHIKPNSSYNSMCSLNKQIITKGSDTKVNLANSVKFCNNEDKSYRRSRSCDKPTEMSSTKERAKKCLSSKSIVKINKPSEEGSTMFDVSKNKSPSSQKRKKRRKFRPRTCESTNHEKKPIETETKIKKKTKLKKTFLANSLSFNESPYLTKKKKSKSAENRKKNGKDRDTGGQ